MILVAEIGGTKLQLAAFDPERARLSERWQDKVDPALGARGILSQFELAIENMDRSRFTHCGVGFGGPIDANGVIFKSHQIDGWEQFALTDWFQQRLGIEVFTANDCDAAALGEFQFGAGRNHRSLFYVTVGTGVGGGLVLDSGLHGLGRPAAAEIGHLRPGLNCSDATATVESYSSGWGICRQTARVANLLRQCREQPRELAAEFPELASIDFELPSETEIDRSLDWYESRDRQPDASEIGRGALDSVWLPSVTIRLASRVLGWALAQATTLIAPEVVVVGGGVSKLPDDLFMNPVRHSFMQYCFEPLQQTTSIVHSKLGDDVVLWGAAAHVLGQRTVV